MQDQIRAVVALPQAAPVHPRGARASGQHSMQCGIVRCCAVYRIPGLGQIK